MGDDFNVKTKMEEIKSEKRSKKIPKKIPAKEVLQESTAKELNENISGMISSVSQMTKSTLGLTKKFASLATSPLVTSASAIGEDFKVDKSKMLGVGVASALNPILGYLAEKVAKVQGENIKNRASTFYSQAKDTFNRGSFLKRKSVESNQEEFKGGFADVKGMQNEFMESIKDLSEKTADKVIEKQATTTKKTPINRSGHKLQWTTYNRNHGSRNETEAIDLLRISNAEWMKAMGSLTPDEMSQKPLPRAKKGAYVRRTGKAIVHEGEVIAPVNILSTVLKELGKIRKILSEGRVNVSLAGTQRGNKFDEFKIIPEKEKMNQSALMGRLLEQGQTTQRYKSIEQMGMLRKEAALVMSPFREEKEGTVLGRMASNIEKLTYHLGAHRAERNLSFTDRLGLVYSKLFRSSPFFYHLTRTIARFGSFFRMFQRKKKSYGVQLDGDTPFEQMVSGEKRIINLLTEFTTGQKLNEKAPTIFSPVTHGFNLVRKLGAKTIHKLLSTIHPSLAKLVFPHAAEGGFIKKEGLFKGHTGEIITPFDVIKKQTLYLKEILKNKIEGNAISTQQVRLQRELNESVVNLRTNLYSIGSKLKADVSQLAEKETYKAGYGKVKEKIKNIKDKIKPYLDKFGKTTFGKYLKETFNEWGLVFSPFKMLIDSLRHTFSYMKKKGLDFTKYMSSISYKKGLNFLGNTMEFAINLSSKIPKGFSGTMDRINKGVDFFVDFLFSPKNKTFEKIGSTGPKALQASKSYAITMWEMGKEFIKKPTDWKKVGTAIKGYGVALWDTGSELVKKSWATMKNSKKVVEGIKSFGLGVAEIAKNTWSKGKGFIKNIGSFINGLTDFAKMGEKLSKGGGMFSNVFKFLFGSAGGALVGGLITAGLGLLAVVWSAAESYLKTVDIFGPGSGFQEYAATFAASILKGSFFTSLAQGLLNLDLHIIDYFIGSNLAHSSLAQFFTQTDFTKMLAPYVKSVMGWGEGMIESFVSGLWMMGSNFFSMDDAKFEKLDMYIMQFILGDTLSSWAMGKERYETALNREIDPNKEGIIGGIIFGVLQPLWKGITSLGASSGIHDVLSDFFGGMLSFMQNLFDLQRIKIWVYKKAESLGMSWMMPEEASKELFIEAQREKAQSEINQLGIQRKARDKEAWRANLERKAKKKILQAESKRLERDFVGTFGTAKMVPSELTNLGMEGIAKAKAYGETEVAQKTIQSTKELGKKVEETSKATTASVFNATNNIMEGNRMFQQSIINAPNPDNPFFKQSEVGSGFAH